MYRLEDRGLTLRLFRNALDVQSAGLTEPTQYGFGYIAKNDAGRWMDAHGPLPLDWVPLPELLQVKTSAPESTMDIALRVCVDKKTRVFSDGEINIFATSGQFDEMVKQLVASKVERLLAALDVLDHGCAKPGFKEWQNGHGAPVGDEVQAAREELAAFVAHAAVLDVDVDDDDDAED